MGHGALPLPPSPPSPRPLRWALIRRVLGSGATTVLLVKGDTDRCVSGNVASSDLGRYHKEVSAALLQFGSASANTAGGWPPLCFCKRQLY